ncbi:MAG: hypothetical protein QOJ67_2552 [Acidimicrobiaceae bacterium]
MLFTADAHAGLASGEITLTFRRWKRAQAKVGGRYNIGGTMLQVDVVERLLPGDITDAEARKAGSADRTALLALLERGSAGPLGDDELVWRIEFHRTELSDARALLAASDELSDDDVLAINRSLDRLDRTGAGAPWTRAVLALIDERPGVVSTELAASRGVERAPFKLDVRKLKRLGLTESLEVGYRLSPRGRAFIDRTR